MSRDLTGEVFGHITVVGPSEDRATDGHRLWNCECACGHPFTIKASNIVYSSTKKYCGRWECDFHPTGGIPIIRWPAYTIWQAIKARCLNPKHINFENYGARGITVCDEWMHSYPAFWKDMGPTYEKGLSIDRIDVDGNYEPSNCKWSTPLEQARNKRNNVYVKVNGKPYVLAEAAGMIDMVKSSLYALARRSRPATPEFFILEPTT